MILNDRQIEKLAKEGMLVPFETKLISRTNSQKVLSYGLSSFGYDIRLSSEDFRIFEPLIDDVVDPKNFNLRAVKNLKVQEDDTGKFFLMPAHSYALGVSIEKFDIPEDIVGQCIGKSTYARCGLYVNVTLIEPGWRGFLTLELCNEAPTPLKVYPDEGIAQILFYRGDKCSTSYKSRNGKYQNQENKVVLPKV